MAEVAGTALVPNVSPRAICDAIYGTANVLQVYIYTFGNSYIIYIILLSGAVAIIIQYRKNASLAKDAKGKS